MGFPDNFVDDVRRNADIVRVISDHVGLKKVGGSWKGLCPFHQEKTPSFNVRSDPALFHCFGCGEGGDVFKFVMLREGCSFPAAVESLGRRLGLEIPESDYDAGPERKLRTQIREALEAAAQHYARNLRSPAGARARAYLHGRGFKDDTLERIQAGAARDSWEDLSRALETRFARDVLLNAGLVLPGKDGRRPYDRFRDRVVFPIFDESGCPVGFGARLLGAGEPKYLNSPETAVYQKGRVLYGLSWAKDALRREGYAVLMEGYLDVARALEAGVGAAVATCGTALTTFHARLLRRFTGRVLLNFDQDEAGRKAARKSFEVLAPEGLHVHVVELPEGHDPDTFLKEAGAEAYRERLEAAPPFMEWLIRTTLAAHKTDTPEGKAGFLDDLLPALRRVDNAVERAAWLAEAASRAGLNRAAAEQELRKLPGERVAPTPPTPPAPARRRTGRPRLLPAEKWLLALLLKNAPGLPEALAELDGSDLDVLASGAVFRAARAQLPTLDVSALCAGLENEALRDLLTAMAVKPVPTGDATPWTCVREIKSWPLRARMAEIGRAIQNAAPDEEDALLREKQELRRRISVLEEAATTV